MCTQTWCSVEHYEKSFVETWYKLQIGLANTSVCCNKGRNGYHHLWYLRKLQYNIKGLLSRTPSDFRRAPSNQVKNFYPQARQVQRFWTKYVKHAMKTWHSPKDLRNSRKVLGNSVAEWRYHHIPPPMTHSSVWWQVTLSSWRLHHAFLSFDILEMFGEHKMASSS